MARPVLDRVCLIIMSEGMKGGTAVGLGLS